MRRSKRGPPKDRRCDATNSSERQGNSRIALRCINPATVELLDVPWLWGQAWVCETCAQGLEKKYGGEVKHD
jgi:hypothetical protein